MDVSSKSRDVDSGQEVILEPSIKCFSKSGVADFADRVTDDHIEVIFIVNVMIGNLESIEYCPMSQVVEPMLEDMHVVLSLMKKASKLQSATHSELAASPALESLIIRGSTTSLKLTSLLTQPELRCVYSNFRISMLTWISTPTYLETQS